MQKIKTADNALLWLLLILRELCFHFNQQFLDGLSTHTYLESGRGILAAILAVLLLAEKLLLAELSSTWVNYNIRGKI